MWELLTLQVPFAGLHFGQITLQVPRDGLRPPVPESPSDVPGGPSLPGLEAYITLMHRCCALAHRRYASDNHCVFRPTGHEDPGMRPNFATALTLLQDVVHDAKGAARGGARALT